MQTLTVGTIEGPEHDKSQTRHWEWTPVGPLWGH